ncbi:MAG: type II secretion system secretin GspD [Bdellovibrionales bacterium]|nr:type II secretion system secretin GspD [Bdellovibrionales bacterium]
MMIALILIGFGFAEGKENTNKTLKTNSILLAQNNPAGDEDFFDDELEALEEIDAELDQVPVVDEPAPPPPEPTQKPSSRFNRNSRFQRAQPSNQNNTNPEPPAMTDTTPVDTGPATKIDGFKIDKKVKPKSGKKMSFAEAQPEDITNENFPDLIESFDYPNADIMDVAKAISKLTKKNFIFEPGVRGKISIVAPSKITVAEAWEAFLSALAMNGFTIVPAGKFLKIRKESNAKNDSIETYSGAYYPTSDQLITRIIKLKYIGAEDVKKSLEKFVSKKAGDVEAYEKTNSLIVSGYGSSVERISRIIEQLDQPGFEEKLEVIPIRHAKAKDISELIEKIIKDGEDKQQNSRFRSSRFNQQNDGKAENLKLVAPDDRTNSIIVVGNEQGIDRIRNLVKRLDYPLDPADAGGVYVYYVKHGEAAKIAETLSGIAEESTKAAEQSTKKSTGKDDPSFTPPKVQKPIFSNNVVIKADENTNSLIVTASKQDYKVVKNLLAKIDIPKDQVFVEAVIMEMEANNSSLWNLNYMSFQEGDDASSSTTTGGGVARQGFIGGNIADLISPTGGKGAILNIGDPNNTVNITGPGGTTIQIPSLIALINFLKEKTNGNILSTPNILAMDNEESEIEVGDEVPVASTQAQLGTTTGVVSTPQFKDATILLKIKPFISPDSDIVRLNVEQKISKVSTAPIRAEALASSTQALTKKSIKTNIVLENGQTAVLGGLMEDEDTVEEKKVPLLGDIPILGWLFKSRTVRSVKKNLVVFLTPKIIRNTYDHRKILTDKLGDRIDWIKKNAGGVDPYGQKFNSLIQNSSAKNNVVPTTNELELDLEQAVPVGEPAGIEETPVGDDVDTYDEAEGF